VREWSALESPSSVWRLARIVGHPGPGAKGGGTRRRRASARAGVDRGAVAGRSVLRSAVRCTSPRRCVLQPLPSVCCRQSSRPPRPALLRRSAVVPPLCPPSAPPSLRCGACGRCGAAASAFGVLFLKDAHPRLRFSLFRGGWRWFGRSFRGRRSRQEASRRRRGQGGFGLRHGTMLRGACAPSSLRQRASPRLAPLASSHRATPPAFARALTRRPRMGGSPFGLRSLALTPSKTPPIPRRFCAASAPRHGCAPPLRGGVLGERFGWPFPVGGVCWLALPPAEPSPQAEPFRRPTAIPLDPPSPPAAVGLYRFCVRKSRWATAWRNRVRAAAQPSLVAVGGGRSRLGKHGSGVVRPRGMALAARTRALRAKPQPSPALGRCGPVVAGAPPPRTAPPTVQRRWRGA